MKKKLVPLFVALGMMATGCSSGAKQVEALMEASATADKMIPAEYNHNVEVDEQGTGLDVAFRLADSLVNVRQIGPELFEALASLNLREYRADDLNAVVEVLRNTKGDVNVELISTSQESSEYKLSPSQLLKLRTAKLTQLNTAAIKSQIVDVAADFFVGGVPAGATSVETAIVKSFLEYNVEWPSASSYATREQGWLTYSYFNQFKRIYADVNASLPGLIPMLTSLGIDGIRVVYSAPDSERQLRQAFPWRELEKPIEDFPIVKTK